MPEIDQNRVPTSKSGESSPVLLNLFGKYEVGKLLGCGAFATVYHARNVNTGQSLAIKAVSKQKVLKGGFTEHVKREISIMRRLHHPHIVRLFEVLATKTKIYFVMEFAKGREFFAKVAKGRFSEVLSRKYFHQLIAAVEYCHSRGVFHRDLKPENILLNENWELKVSDFGLSAVTDQICSDGLLHTLCGTPAYLAPEVLAKKGYDGAKVDVWSCGVILYVLHAGYLPFNDPNLMVMYRKIQRGEFRYPKWTSPDLRRLISRLLDTNPETRITVDEIICDPWFRIGYKEIKFQLDDSDFKHFGDVENANRFNAFDLIWLSSGFDLSSLANKDSGISTVGEIFLSAESPEGIIKRIEEISETENVKMDKKEWGVKMEGENGNFLVVIDIYRLTEKLVVVEIRSRERKVRPSQQFWKDKLRPQILNLIYQSD